MKYQANKPYGIEERIVWIVDPEPDNADLQQKIYKTLIEKSGQSFEVELVRSLDDFETKLASYKPDVILLNPKISVSKYGGLPDGRFLEVLEWAKSQKPEPKVIIFSEDVASPIISLKVTDVDWCSRDSSLELIIKYVLSAFGK